MWHFGFGGRDMKRLVAGRERIYLDRFWSELSRGPERFDEAKREHYAALYAQPGAMRASFAQFLSFIQDAADNRTFLAEGRLQMPVLAFGGEATFGPLIGDTTARDSFTLRAGLALLPTASASSTLKNLPGWVPASSKCS